MNIWKKYNIFEPISKKRNFEVKFEFKFENSKIWKRIVKFEVKFKNFKSTLKFERKFKTLELSEKTKISIF